MAKKTNNGIYIPPNIKPFPKEHELYSARALADRGYSIKFLIPDNRAGSKTADIKLNDEIFEIKSPTGKISSIERNLKRAVKQSNKIVFDCRRMKINNSKVIIAELKKRLKKQKNIEKILMIDRHGHVIDINSLI